jgi:hypothetical protein
MAVPEIYVLDCERGINSFAAGHTRDDVAIGVTRGCVKLLTRDELQGVIAHEFSHVLNGDTRLNMKLMGWRTDFSGRRLSAACCCAARRNRRKSANPFLTRTPSPPSCHRAHRDFIFDRRRHQLAVRAPAQEPDLPRARMAGGRGGGAGHDDVILFAFAQQEVFAEKQIASRSPRAGSWLRGRC